MKKLIVLFSALSLSLAVAANASAQDYPSTVKDVAVSYAKAFFTGDQAAAQFVNFDGANVMDIATTPALLESDIFPKELKKNAGKKKTVAFSGSNPGDFDGQFYVTLKVGGKDEYLLLTQVDGKWKVDFSAWYFSKYYDGY